MSELADYRVPSVEDVVKIGDEVMVMVTEIDRMGRINLSRRVVLEGKSSEDVRKESSSRQERSDRPERNGERGNSRGRDRGGRDRGDRS